MHSSTFAILLAQTFTIVFLSVVDALPLLTDAETSNVQSDGGVNNGLFFTPGDVFRNRPNWLFRDVDSAKNADASSLPDLAGPVEQRSVRSISSSQRSPSSSSGGRSRPCYFSPVQCVLYQQQFKNGASEGANALEVIRPLMNSASSRKRQTMRHNALSFQRWRSSSEPVSHFRL